MYELHLIGTEGGKSAEFWLGGPPETFSSAHGTLIVYRAMQELAHDGREVVITRDGVSIGFGQLREDVRHETGEAATRVSGSIPRSAGQRYG